MTAVMGVWTTRRVSTFCSTPSSRTRNLSLVRPGTNWWFLSRMTLTSRLTRGTSTRREKVSPLGFLTVGSAGAGGGGGSSDSFFLGMTMGPLSIEGPPESGVWSGLWADGAAGGGAAGACAWAAGSADNVARMSGARSAASTLWSGRIGEVLLIENYYCSLRVGRCTGGHGCARMLRRRVGWYSPSPL